MTFSEKCKLKRQMTIAADNKNGTALFPFMDAHDFDAEEELSIRRNKDKKMTS